MYWVMLTRARDNNFVYVNLDRFDRIEIVTDEDGNKITLISTTLSSTEEDVVELEVKEKPEDFLPTIESENFSKKKFTGHIENKR